jgi:hypothetical protein
MDVSMTAQTIQQAAETLQAAQRSLSELNTAAAPLAAGAQAGLTPLQLALAAGPLMAHSVQPFVDKLPASFKPVILAVGMAAATAATAMTQGSTWQAAAGYGVATALAAKGWHLAFLKNGGLLDALNAFAKAPTGNTVINTTQAAPSAPEAPVVATAPITPSTQPTA